LSKANKDNVKTCILDWVLSNWKYSYQDSSQVLKELSRIWGAQNCLGFVLSEEMGPTDPLSVLSLEAQADIESSILLAISGFYRHATLVLRSWLALGYASVWFSFNFTGFNLWMKRDANAPFRYRGVMNSHLLQELMSKTEHLKKASKAFNLVKNGMRLHLELSDFVHSRGREALDIYQRDDSVPHYYSERLRSWFDRFRQVFEIWVILIFARYPQLLKTVRHPQEKEQVLSALSNETRARFQSLSKD